MSRIRVPATLVICGPPASGKSALAAAAATLRGGPVLSSDLIRKELAGIAASSRAAPEDYSEARSLLVYGELGRRAAACVQVRRPAIVDATFRRRTHRAAFSAAFGHAAPVLYAECRAPLATLIARAAARD